MINRKIDAPPRYVLSSQQLILNLDILRIICDLQADGNAVVVATNQQAIGKKLISLKNLNDIHETINNELLTMGGSTLKFYICPHLVEDNCACRKPKPGLLLEAMKDFFIEKSRTIFVGDMDSDSKAAKAAGVEFILHTGDSEDLEKEISNRIGNTRIDQ